VIKSCDSGSLPVVGEFGKFLDGANSYNTARSSEAVEYFEMQLVKSYLDKLRVGVEVPNYPQFRDMNEMFLSMIDGIEKVDAGYIETKPLSLKSGNQKIPEVAALEKHSQMIQYAYSLIKGCNSPFEVRVCITGPYTLSSFFPYRDEQIFGRLANIIVKVLESNLFSNAFGKTSVVSVDEPLFGLMDDPRIDFGQNGRENLHRAWEKICKTIRTKNAQTMLHLHSTSNELFWDVDSLQVIDSHVGDPLHTMNKTKRLLESKDKFLKASITVNDFDKLIKAKITADSPQKLAETDVNEKIASTWTDIKNGRVDPDLFLETVDGMKNRLKQVVERFGEERILYAGPECGLKGYPTYANALECLRRVAVAVKG
jgi:5-methyltetrahydropteroyltriglutamate--homocysteine methyltransferase